MRAHLRVFEKEEECEKNKYINKNIEKKNSNNEGDWKVLHMYVKSQVTITFNINYLF